MKILITGASGLVGSKIITELLKLGHTDLYYLTRSKTDFESKFSWPGQAVEWDYKNKTINTDVLKDIEGVIHLAGESIADGRWSKSRKESIMASRSEGTKFLIDSLNEHAPNLKTFVSTSAIGYYGSFRTGDVLDESSSKGNDFLSSVCQEWEKPLNGLKDNVRTVIIRTGIVLANNGGALEKMLPPFLNYAGGKIASGKQYMSWIHISDLAKLYIESLLDTSFKGVYNGVAPKAVTNNEFTKALGKALNKPTLFPVPGFMLKLVFGEMSSIILGDQNVTSKRLSENNFQFQFKNINDALNDLLHYMGQGFLLFESYQYIARDKNSVFEFFSEAKNLEKITPDFLNFKITNMSTDKIEEGSLIDYKLKIHGIPAKWKTEIKEWNPNDSFIDIQLKGPYNKWIHLHEFHQAGQGCLIRDFVRYKVPLSKLGALLTGAFIKKDINKIFGYRKEKVKELFA